MNREFIPITIFVSVIICVGIFLAYMIFATNNAVVHFATVTVPANGLTFKDGIIESPALILEVNEEKFLAIATLNHCTVYGYRSQFYIFNSDMTIAYRYTPTIFP